jgi:integrative and conjugative element protein (TIGR02256 family)
MREWADTHFPDEVGGMLVGYEADTGDVVVREVVGPGPLATHGATRFQPDSVYQQSQLEEKFARSGGVNTYLGDWHTHPRGVSELSATDRRTLARIAHKKYDCTNTPTMVVLADGVGSRWEIGAYRAVEKTWWSWRQAPDIERLRIRFF